MCTPLKLKLKIILAAPVTFHKVFTLSKLRKRGKLQNHKFKGRKPALLLATNIFRRVAKLLFKNKGKVRKILKPKL